ncbi:hypothetical protein JW707_05265 [Candidatus Woesearchaeota archaeon]|nr:hypothetical protein [Candidatus Woesearchaeota archaeon]
MISPDVDIEKTRLLLKHLGRSSARIKQKDTAKEELKDQIKKLKKTIKSKAYKKEMKVLEKKLAGVLEKEEEIIRHHKAREAANRRIREKIESLENKLTRYIATKKLRERRVEELQSTIKRRFSVEQKEIEILEEQIMNLETLFERIRHDKKYTEKELGRVKSKIEILKKRLEKIK